MSKKVLVSTTSVHVKNILDYHGITDKNDRNSYDKLNDSKFGNRYLKGSVIFDETVFTEEALSQLPKEYLRVLEIPDGYEIISDSAINGDEQMGLILAKDIIYIDTTNDILPEAEEEKLKEFIVPFSIDK